MSTPRAPSFRTGQRAKKRRSTSVAGRSTSVAGRSTSVAGRLASLAVRLRSLAGSTGMPNSSRRRDERDGARAVFRSVGAGLDTRVLRRLRYCRTGFGSSRCGQAQEASLEKYDEAIAYIARDADQRNVGFLHAREWTVAGATTYLNAEVSKLFGSHLCDSER
jgi:hypothetical protein